MTLKKITITINDSNGETGLTAENVPSIYEQLGILRYWEKQIWLISQPKKDVKIKTNKLKNNAAPRNIRRKK